ncbi:MAG: hypothetical protein ACREER_00820 [Alphaproteobacteria bacterium]
MAGKNVVDPILLDDDAALPMGEPAAPESLDLLSSADPSAGTADDAVTLTLGDLIADDAGEVVLAADNVAISLKADGHVVDGGIAAEHVTLTGVDVSGLSFATLDTGITIYYSGQVEFIL